LGTTSAWLDAGGVPRTPGRVVQECGEGLVPVRIDDANVAVALSGLGVTPTDAVLAAEPDLAARVTAQR